MDALPPILPDITKHLQSFLISPENLPIHEYQRSQEYWPRTPDITELLHHDVSPLSTTLAVERDPNTGEIIEFKEVSLEAAGATASNSMSLNRAPGPLSESVRGSATNVPFWPGGFPKLDEMKLKNFDELNKTDDLLYIPPGFTRGLLFEEDGFTVKSSQHETNTNKFLIDNKVDLLEVIQQSEELLGVWKTQQCEDEKPVEAIVHFEPIPEESDVLPPTDIVVSKPAPEKNKFKDINKQEWAILLDSNKPINNFKEVVPELAHNYPFELDNFQKYAIMHLEMHNHVFVAAHTSAGKTVVAEYAIALSQKHKTKTIYTSPIKALSNQKYRDFKQTFKDVGLITGDFQINQTANCLIMTTEILRSMLYCGSDVTRDLEFVIFDEVHYINDEDRGHVWEQVLILLPAHVCVVLLSATVSNTLQFAEWLGQTHKRNVYVICTYQRPVPLKHYLYTGTGGASKNNRFCILNAKGWLDQGYSRAKETINAKPYKLNLNQNKTMWYAIMDHLKTQNLLPVVVFTFSRSRCDINAESLKGLDLTTNRQKYTIRSFFKECISTLKEPDRCIPQITRMQDLLENGIGVHHSGILPMIKEIVEMLFQNGFIKLLFATETFAMGVNMPARTVIFDSIRKHDSQTLRNLLPAEYIQMAGRAGRRGKDSEGTVIILCKNQMPTEKDLKDMMLGKPSELRSKFKLTYGMVLSLLRVEFLSVESMLMRSFGEADHQKNMDSIKQNLEMVESKLYADYDFDFSEYLSPLISFYETAREFINMRKEVFNEIITSGQCLKELTPGRIIKITHKGHLNKLALILMQTTKRDGTTFQVLVLSDDVEVMDDTKNDLWYKMLGLSRSNHVFQPTEPVKHCVITISTLDIFEITSTKLKIDSDVILKDWNKRQIPRFSSDPPGPSCANAIQELKKITFLCDELRYLDLVSDLKVNDIQLSGNASELSLMKQMVNSLQASVEIPNFEAQFQQVFDKKVLEDERDHLRYLLSNHSLQLYTDYESRLKLLRHLNYVDAENHVELKGRVACEMGMNELMVTELVLRNILTKLKPAEVAALLSCMVFQGKINLELSSFQLTEDLRQAIQQTALIHDEIVQLEQTFRIIPDSDSKLNFGLVKVVFEWASAKPFSNIMALTDVQEGIIVRCIQQLNETICDVRNAARIIGDPELQNKMEEASAAIKRDIVFAASLYTQRETTSLKKSD